MRLLSLLTASLLLAAPASAQFDAPAAPCEPGDAVGFLTGHNVEAVLFPNGSLFYDSSRPAEDSYYTNGYLVPLSQTAPDGRPPSPIDAATFWVGGLVGDSLRTASAGYGDYVFRPGQIGPDGVAPTPSECAESDRIWVVSREDLDAYYRGGVPTDDLADWPVHLGAPVFDGDGVPGNYDLAAGDQPAIRGDVMAFWVMNDAVAEVGDSYPLRRDLPVGVDVAVEAFAFNDPSLHTDTFYRFTVTNRNTVPLNQAYVSMAGLWSQRSDADYRLGTDVGGDMLYVYSPRERPDTYPAGLYEAPPASGLVVLEGPAGTDGERRGMTSSRYLYKSPGVHAFPATPAGVYNAQLGRMNNGMAIIAYGDGFQPSNQPPYPETVYHWPGDPITLDGWSEVDPDNDGEAEVDRGSDLRMGALSSGPFSLEPNASTSATFALAFAQGDDRIQSIRLLRQRARALTAAVGSGLFEPSRVPTSAMQPPPALTVTRPAPNPFTGATALTFTGVEGARLTVAVYDALGREVRAPLAVEADGAVEVGDGLAPGVYLVRIAGLAFEEAFPIAKVR